MVLPRLLAELTAIGCTSTLIDAYWQFARLRLPDGRWGWAEPKPGDEIQEQGYRIIIRPSHPIPILLQWEPAPVFADLLLRSKAQVQFADPPDCHPMVAVLLSRLYRQPSGGLTVVR